MDNTTLVKLKEDTVVKILEPKEPTDIETSLTGQINSINRKIKTENWLNRVLKYILPLSILVIYIFYVIIRFFRVHKGENFWYHLWSIGKAVLITSGVLFVTVYIFHPKIKQNQYILQDVRSFGIQDDENGKKDKADIQTAKKGIARTFDMKTSVNLDNAMFAIRDMTGYSENREDDIVDTASIIRDIVVPRILASMVDEIPITGTDLAGAGCKNRVNNILNGDVEKDAKTLEECKKSVAEKCMSFQDSSNNNYKVLECNKLQIGTGTRTGFSWIPDSEKDPLSFKDSSECKTACENIDECNMSVFNDNKCYILNGNKEENRWNMLSWEDKNSEIYIKKENIETLPLKINPETSDAKIVVDDILARIKVVTRIVDMTPFRDEILEGIRNETSKYNGNKAYINAILNELSLESKNQSDPGVKTEDGGEVKVDLARVDLYMSNTKVAKFKNDIAWPIIHAAVNVSARNVMFNKIAERQISVSKFNNIYTYTTISAIIGVIITYGFLNALSKFDILIQHKYPLVPIIVLEIVLYVSILSIVTKGLHKFGHAAKKQAENSNKFANELANLANLLSGTKFETNFKEGVNVKIESSLLDAVIQDSPRNLVFSNMLQNDDLTLSKAISTTGRDNLIKQIAIVLERYDKCHNIMYRGGIPFPTATVTAYLGLVIIGLGAFFSLPGVNPATMMKQLDLARALHSKANDVMEEIASANNANVQNMLRDKHQSYLDKLCELWKETNSKTLGVKSTIRNLAVFLSCLFGVQYVVTTSTETAQFINALGSGTLGIIGNCVFEN